MNHYRHIITNHRTLHFESPTAKVSVRKDKGLYYVRLHDRYYHKRVVTPYKTLQGAIQVAENLRKAYL